MSKSLPTTNQRTSLHDIAPRLAVARDVRNWERDSLGELDGQDFARVHRAIHTTGRCRHCGGAEDQYEMDRELLHGVNKGDRRWEFAYRCRSCRTAGFSNYRRPW